MNLATAMVNESRKKLTENGATAYSSTGSAMLDLFGCIGSLRSREESDICRLFVEAYKENPLLATKCLFYCRDVRGGLGERRTFRVIMRYCAQHHPEAILPNIKLVGDYGRYDDLYDLVGTQLESEMWAVMTHQLHLDTVNMKRKKTISLLAKWIKTPDASSSNTRRLGIATAQAMGLTVYDFKRKLRAMRKYLDVVERHMSANEWSEIQYPAVPSRAMMIYRNAFKRHDETRYDNFLNAVANGDASINASTLFPYDIVEKYERQYCSDEDATLEAQWKALPNYLDRPANAIVIADTSGSMTRANARPLYSSLALAIYFAERNTGAYHNLWMSFSHKPTIHRLQGETLIQKLRSIERAFWHNETNLELAFRRILDIAIQNHVPAEEMVKSLIIVSDMEIDEAQSGYAWSFYDSMRKLYMDNGYIIPNIVFWNVFSRNDTFLADKSRVGVQLCSGQSASTFKVLMKSVGMNPVEMMTNTLMAERYAPVTVRGIEC